MVRALCKQLHFLGGFLGFLIQRKWVLGSKVERGRELVPFFRFYLRFNFGLYSKEDFLTEGAEVGNGGLMEATLGGLSDNF